MIDRRKQYRIAYTSSLSWWAYKVQVKYWWFPLWVTCEDFRDLPNRFDKLDMAEAFALKHAQKNNHVIKELGRLP